jgi:hypothetical protein
MLVWRHVLSRRWNGQESPCTNPEPGIAIRARVEHGVARVRAAIHIPGLTACLCRHSHNGTANVDDSLDIEGEKGLTSHDQT